MNRFRHTAFFLIACTFLPALACSKSLLGIELPTNLPAGLSLRDDDRISRNYPQTQCVEFLEAKQRRRSGVLCSSASSEFLSDFGISSTPQAEGTPSGFSVATGMSTYDMSPATVQGHALFTTEVDCNDDDESVYRATSTCHIAYMPLDEHRFLYSNFILRNEATRTTLTEKRTIMEIWERIRLPTTPPQG